MSLSILSYNLSLSLSPHTHSNLVYVTIFFLRQKKPYLIRRFLCACVNIF